MPDPHELFRVIAHSLPALVSYIDRDLRYRWANQAYQRWFGQLPDDMPGRHVGEVLGQAAFDAVRPYMERALAGEVVTFEEEVPYRDAGPRWVHVTYTPDVAAGRIRGFVVLVIDIGEQKAAEARIARLTDDLRARVEELGREHARKDEFIATLAHELRNPLAPIRNAVSILRLRPPDDPQLVRLRDVIDRQAEQLSRLVDDLLDVSRITRGSIELRRARIDVRSIVEAAVETSQPLLDKMRHELVVELPDLPLCVDGDLTRLAQVISNLLNNAAKYTDPGGHLRVAASREGSEVVLRVVDDGIGLGAEMLPRVFEMFAQVHPGGHRSQGGLGIGLTLVRSLVEMHHGTVEARSEGPGRGSEFVVRLPMNGCAADSAPLAASEAARADALRVLVVDDNEDAARTLAELVRALGHDVCATFDGEQALRAAKEAPPDLVLLDLGMPGLDGFGVARRLREEVGTRRTVVVALTGWGGPEARAHTREAGFDLHLVKPPELATLRQAIASAVARRASRAA